MTTIDEAKRCPKCGNAGEESGNHRGPRGSRVYTFICKNETCRWFDTGWLVQVKPDGTIPEREPGEKEFPAMPDFDVNKERTEEAIKRQVEQETK